MSDAYRPPQSSNKKWLLCCWSVCCVFSISAHLSAQNLNSNPDQQQRNQQAQQNNRQELRNGFGDLTLGASLAQISEQLNSSAYFAFDAAINISIIPLSRNALISVDGTDYVERGFLQFDDDALISIQLILDPRQLDHFSLYRALSDKYGEPNSLNPQVTSWESEAVRISIERPLILKYIDLRYFTAEQRRAEEEQQGKQSVLDAFFQQL